MRPHSPLGALGENQQRVGSRWPVLAVEGQANITLLNLNYRPPLLLLASTLDLDSTAHHPFRRQSSNSALQIRTMLWLMYAVSAMRLNASRRPREMYTCATGFSVSEY